MIDERVLQTLRHEFAISEARLGEYVADHCPGPQHRVVQHRDAKPPWFKACGRTGLGTRVKEIADE